MPMEEPGLFKTIVHAVGKGLAFVTRGQAPEPSSHVVELLASLKMTPRDLNQLYRVFAKLQQFQSRTVAPAAGEIAEDSLLTLVAVRRYWIKGLLANLCELGGCRDSISWDAFLYIFLRFCSLSKVELCQCLFYLITKHVKSWTVHYLTSTQLQEFYDFYANCPVNSFSTKSISFTRLPLNRYYMSDFVELVHRFGQLINPLVHLQRSLQQNLPCIAFWDDYDRIEVLNRKITLSFFLMTKKKAFASVLESADVNQQDFLRKYEEERAKQKKIREEQLLLYGGENMDPSMPPMGSMSPMAQGQLPMSPMAQGQLPMSPMAQGQLPMSPMAQGQQPMSPMAQGQLPMTQGQVALQSTTGGQPMGGPAQPGLTGAQSMPALPANSMASDSTLLPASSQTVSGLSGTVGPGMSSIGTSPSQPNVQIPQYGTSGLSQSQSQSMPQLRPTLPQLVLGALKSTFGTSRARMYEQEDPGPYARFRHAGQLSPGAAARLKARKREIPAWIRQYMDMPRRTRLNTRFEEVDFIRKSRMREHHRDNIVSIIERSSPCELLDRPGQGKSKVQGKRALDGDVQSAPGLQANAHNQLAGRQTGAPPGTIPGTQAAGGGAPGQMR